MTIIGTSIILSVEVKAATSSSICEETVIKAAYPSCPRCGGKIYPGQNHVCTWWIANKENSEVNAEVCIECGGRIGPTGYHKCSNPYV
ncbi:MULTISPECIES: hypothetical protein [Clostridium]|uniref:hypothetical protein n=1 Tax=Clostridium TaxID=1485 RepID=UPI001A9AC74A|nr:MULTISPECIES: hypothetical protein [Clostridium]MDU1349854.1 hypothetical protein [Clostridium argentinense]